MYDDDVERKQNNISFRVSQEMSLVSITGLENAGEKFVVINSSDALCPEDNVHFIMP